MRFTLSATRYVHIMRPNLFFVTCNHYFALRWKSKKWKLKVRPILDAGAPRNKLARSGLPLAPNGGIRLDDKSLYPLEDYVSCGVTLDGLKVVLKAYAGMSARDPTSILSLRPVAVSTDASAYYRHMIVCNRDAWKLGVMLWTDAGKPNFTATDRVQFGFAQAPENAPAAGAAPVSSPRSRPGPRGRTGARGGTKGAGSVTGAVPQFRGCSRPPHRPLARGLA